MSVYPKLWTINMATADYGETTFRITLDGTMVEMTFAELKQALLNPTVNRCLTCVTSRVQSTTQLMREFLGEA